MNEIFIHLENPNCSVSFESPDDAAAFVERLGGKTARIRRGGAPEASSEPVTRRPRKAARDASEAPSGGRGAVKAKVLAFVAKHPVVDLGELAVAVYGEDTKQGRNSAGTTLRMAVKRGDVKKLANGEHRIA